MKKGLCQWRNPFLAVSDIIKGFKNLIRIRKGSHCITVILSQK